MKRHRSLAANIKGNSLQEIEDRFTERCEQYFGPDAQLTTQIRAEPRSVYNGDGRVAYDAFEADCYAELKLN